jgi:hypothetical protein
MPYSFEEERDAPCYNGQFTALDKVTPPEAKIVETQVPEFTGRFRDTNSQYQVDTQMSQPTEQIPPKEVTSPTSVLGYTSKTTQLVLWGGLFLILLFNI